MQSASEGRWMTQHSILEGSSFLPMCTWEQQVLVQGLLSWPLPVGDLERSLSFCLQSSPALAVGHTWTVNQQKRRSLSFCLSATQVK